MFKPMLAATVDELDKLVFPLYGSPKLDGIRCCIVDGVPLTRKLKPIPNVRLTEQLTALCEGLPFDGELMLPGGDFNDVQSAVMKRDGKLDGIEYHVFDFVAPQVFTERLKLYRLNLKVIDHIRLTPVKQVILENEAELLEYEERMVNKGYEGIMLRKPDSPYKFGRSTMREQYLMKMKRFHDAEAEIIGFEERMHNTNEQKRNELGKAKRSSAKAGLVPTGTLGSLIVRDQVTTVTFSIGTGMDDNLRASLWNKQKSLLGQTVTYKYQERSKYGVPRFPVFKTIRKD